MTYAGFWRRFGAFWLDVAVFFPIGLFAIWFYGQTQLAASIWLVPAIAIGAWFHVYLVKRYGGTPGKLLLGLRIVRVDGTPVGYKEATLRYLPLLVLGALASAAFVIASWKLNEAEYMALAWRERHLRLEQLTPSWYRSVLVLENLWIWSEFLVMMTNRKRRALHDFLAGTVVIVTTLPFRPGFRLYVRAATALDGKINRLAITSVVLAGLAVLSVVSGMILLSAVPSAKGHYSAFYSPAGPLIVFTSLCSFILGPCALITGIVSLKRIRTLKNVEKGKALAWSAAILGGTLSGFYLGTIVMIIFAVRSGTLLPHQQEVPWKFEEDFSSRRGGWPTGTNRGDEFGYGDGKYRILIKVKEGQVAAGQIAGIPLAGRRFQTLTVEAGAVQRTGPQVVLHGLACGTSPAELYLFLINLDGSYFIVRDDAGTASADLLQRGRASAPIRGIGETNRIRAQCIGGEQEALLILTVNGAKVAEARGQRGASFDRAMFVVTTLQAIVGSTHTVVPGVSQERPGSPTSFEAEILFDNFVARTP